MVGYAIYAYHSASVFRHDCRDDSVEVETIHIMESGETVSGGEDNVVEGKYFTHEETFPKDMINIPVGKGPMLARWCGGALSEACRTEKEHSRVPQLTQWVVQISHRRCFLGSEMHSDITADVQILHLRCSVGRDALGSHSSRSGLYRNRTSGAPGRDAFGFHNAVVGCTDIAPPGRSRGDCAGGRD